MISFSHMNISIVGFGNVGRCIVNSLLQDHHRKYRINIIDPSHEVVGSLRDLGHTSMLTKRHQILVNDKIAFNNAHFIFFCAGESIPIGKSRDYGLIKNREIVSQVFSGFEPHNNPTIFTLSNPVDVLALEIMKASGIPPENIIGIGTIVETLRLTHQLSVVSGIDPEEIETIVVGEHGETCVPLISNTFIRDIPVKRLLSDELIADCIYEMRRAAHRIKETQGAAYYAAANAAVFVFHMYLESTNVVLPLSVYHPTDGVFYSSPVEVGRDTIQPVVMHTDSLELHALESSIEKIKSRSAHVSVDSVG